MPPEIEIDGSRLRELALDPNNGVREIVAGLGMSDPTFYQHLDRNPELKKVYQEARDEMRAKRDGFELHRTTGRRTAKRSTKKSGKKATRRTSSPPPRNDNAKGGLSRDLLRKIILEFNHLDVYGQVSEHFQEIRQEMGALL